MKKWHLIKYLRGKCNQANYYWLYNFSRIFLQSSLIFSMTVITLEIVFGDSTETCSTEKKTVQTHIIKRTGRPCALVIVYTDIAHSYPSRLREIFSITLSVLFPFLFKPSPKFTIPWRLCKEFQWEELTPSLASPFMNRETRIWIIAAANSTGQIHFDRERDQHVFSDEAKIRLNI